MMILAAAGWPDVLLAMTWILVAWIVFGATAIGCGLAVLRLLGGSYAADVLVRAFWFGIVFAVAFLQIWHLFLPIDAAAQIALLVLGCAGWVAFGRRSWRVPLSAIGRHPWLSLASTVVLLWLANQAIGPHDLHDFGLYHLPAIRWNQTCAVVPGLGNLHHRLAFNNSSHLLTACTMLGPFRDDGMGIVNGALFSGLAMQTLVAARGVGSSDPGVRFPGVLACALAMPMLVIAAHSTYRDLAIANTSTDVSAGIVLFSASLFAVGLICRPNAPKPWLFSSFVLISALLVTAVTFKLSAGGYAATLWLCVAYVVWRRAPRAGCSKRKLIAASVAVGALTIGPYMVRGVVLSGYGLFPSRLVSVPMEWAMPPEQVDDVRNILYRWGAEGRTGMGWLLRAWMRHKLAFYLPLGLALAAIVVIVSRRRRSGPEERLACKVLLIASSGGLLVWTTTAPAPRFGFQLMWTIAAALSALAAVPSEASDGGQSGPSRWRRLDPAYAGLLAFVLGFWGVRLVVKAHRADSVGTGIVRALVVDPELYEQSRAIERPEVEVRTTDSGLEVFVPKGGRAWDAPLPSAPPSEFKRFKQSLRLRRPGDLCSGFVRDS